jgi:hypothetical protein
LEKENFDTTIAPQKTRNKSNKISIVQTLFNAKKERIIKYCQTRKPNKLTRRQAHTKKK